MNCTKLPHATAAALLSRSRFALSLAAALAARWSFDTACPHAAAGHRPVCKTHGTGGGRAVQSASSCSCKHVLLTQRNKPCLITMSNQM